jgi:hypothetical protein
MEIHSRNSYSADMKSKIDIRSALEYKEMKIRLRILEI